MDRLISEQAVIDAVSEWLYDKTRKESIEDVVKAIPSAEPTEDLISRKRVVEWLENCTDDSIEHAIDSNLEFIPSAEPKTENWKDFALWVAKEIFYEWEYNKDAFAEIACRKLNKLGIVKANGDKWELVEPQESEDKE